MHVPEGLHQDLFGPLGTEAVFQAALGHMNGLLQSCSPPMQAQWLIDGPPFGQLPLGFPPPDKDPQCITQCILATTLPRFFNTDPTGNQFRLALVPPYTSKSKSLNRGYLKVIEGDWLFGLPFPCSELFLHQVLCFMYRGPPTDPDHVVLHLCGHKLCLCPWHMLWGTRGEHRVLAVKKRKRQPGPLQPLLSQPIRLHHFM